MYNITVKNENVGVVNAEPSRNVAVITVPKGFKGEKGDPATVSVGTTSTGVAGTSASVTNSGTAADAVLNFTIPKGDQGIQGIQGEAATLDVGTVTEVTPATSPAVTNSGTINDATFDFSLPRAPSVSVQSTATGAPGTNAIVNGTINPSGDTLLGFTIPRGEQGLTGPTGATGPQGEQGPIGPQGVAGSLSPNLDGGIANTIYTPDQFINAGGAN